jgi:Zn-finger nucleic acid-binding protein
MNCPTDGETLLMSERMGVEIDYCPRCRGVWLDRGELDKLLATVDRDDDDGWDDRRRYDDDRRRYDDDRERPRFESHRLPYGGKRKKKSFLSEMFEFD